MKTLSPEQNRERLARKITELAAHIHAATYRLLCLIHEFDTEDGWEGFGMLSCAHWLNWRCGISLGAAREKVRVAHALVEVPQISAAFEQGVLSYSKVRAMTRVATQENEAELMNIALHGTAAQMEKLVSCYRRVRDGEALERAEVQHQSRSLSYYHDDDGSLVITARFTAEQGAVVLNAIQAAIEAFDADAADNVGGTETTGPQHVAFHTDVAAEASAVGPQPLTGQLDVSAEISVADPQPADSLGQRRADAWVRLAEAALGSDLIPPTAAERYQTVVHIPQTLPGQHLDTACSLDNGQSIAAETAKRLACDASVITITEDPHGNPLHIGRNYVHNRIMCSSIVAC